MPRTPRTSTCLTLLVTCFLACGVHLAHASFHLMQIEQVTGGVDGDTTAQAIQLRMRNSGQQFISQARLVAYDAAGANPIVLINFTADVLHGNLGDRVLITSPNFANYTTPSLTGDFIMANLIPASYLAAGRLTYESDGGTVLWSLSFGGAAYTGSTTGSTTNDIDGQFGPSFRGSVPTRRFRALQFQPSASAASSNNAADYALTTGGGQRLSTTPARASLSSPPKPLSASWRQTITRRNRERTPQNSSFRGWVRPMSL